MHTASSVLKQHETDAPVDFNLGRGSGFGLVGCPTAMLLGLGGTGGGTFGHLTT